jgi:hypothetical protein
MKANVNERGNLDQIAMVKLTELAAGQRLQDALGQALSSKGQVLDMRLTPAAAYAAVKSSEGSIEAYVVPYSVDFHQPVPRALRYGVISERDNPQLANAPQSFLEQLSMTTDGGASSWRQRCWANQVGRIADLGVMRPGDVVMVARELQSSHGKVDPGYYAVRAADHGFAVFESMRNGRSFLVHNAAGDAVKVSLDADPTQRLAQHPAVVRFGLQRIARNDEQEHYVLLGRTSSGVLVPLAKADNTEDRDFMLQRIWEVSTMRQETLRTLEASPLYKYMAENNLTGSVVQQGKGQEPVTLQQMQIEVTPLAPEYANDMDGPGR